MKDIENRQDIENLMKAFYTKALADDVIGYIFTDIAKINLEIHLPIIVDFWEMVLFQTVNFQEKYSRSPMQKHIELNDKESLQRKHFTRWLNLFYSTIDENFAGEKADTAKFRAKAIANTMFMKITEGDYEAVQIVR